MLALNTLWAKEDSIRIPVSISPIVQTSCMKISPMARFLYESDQEFYSRVTVSDAARNEQRKISEIIQNKIGVVFLIAASSHVSGLLKLNNIKYPKRPSKWSYQVPVNRVIQESNGRLTKITDKIPIYKVQELAMKVLEKRYEFNVDIILKKLGISQMEFFAVDEQQWIDVVGIITDHIVKKISEKLNLTPCYLAELVNKTQEEMEMFTLDEVDYYLYNTSKLRNKLPTYKNAAVSSLYKAFNITDSQLANMSDTNISVLNTMGLKSLIELLTTTILKRFHLTISEISSTYEKPNDVAVPCRQEWDSFRSTVVLNAFKNEARNMSIAGQTLASLIHVSHNKLGTLSFQKMHQLLTVVKPIKLKKRMVEEFTLSMMISIHGSRRLNINKRNAIAMIKISTKLSRHQLKILYGWTTHDYHFARLFFVADLAEVCSINVSKHNLFSLARITIGKVIGGFECRSFAALRSIWDQASLRNLKDRFKQLSHVPHDMPITSTVSLLTNSSTKISNHVLSNTPMIKWLLTKISLNDISMLTNYTTDYLKEIPLMRVMVIIHELVNAGSFEDLTPVSFCFVFCNELSFHQQPNTVVMLYSKAWEGKGEGNAMQCNAMQ